MKEFMNTMSMYLEHPFVRYALVVGVLIALCSSLIGVTLVLKRFSFIGDGLSHVAFGAMTIATVMNLSNNMILMMPVTILGAVLLLKSGQNTKIKGDAAIAMISVASLAFGYLIMNIFAGSSNLSGDVCTTLFGSTSILTHTEGEVILCVTFSLLIVMVFVFLYHKIFNVWMAWSVECRIWSRVFHFTGDRAAVKRRSVLAGLGELEAFLTKNGAP